MEKLAEAPIYAVAYVNTHDEVAGAWRLKLIPRAMLPFLLLFTSLYAAAAEQGYQSVDDFMKSLPATPHVTVKRVVDGDLNGDGLSDKVALVSLEVEKNYPVPKLFIRKHSAHTPALSQEAIKGRDASDDAPERELSIVNARPWCRCI